METPYLTDSLVSTQSQYSDWWKGFMGNTEWGTTGPTTGNSPCFPTDTALSPTQMGRQRTRYAHGQEVPGWGTLFSSLGNSL